MVGYGEEKNGYNLFETSTLKTFIERSVQFEEEPIPDFELAPRECSSPQHLDEVSYDSCSTFSDNSDNDMDVYEIFFDQSPLQPKWDEKIVQESEELAGNSQEPRRTRSQTSKASFASDSALAEHYYMLVGSDTQSYQ